MAADHMLIVCHGVLQRRCQLSETAYLLLFLDVEQGHFAVSRKLSDADAEIAIAKQSECIKLPWRR